MASEGTTCANFSASRPLARSGTAQVQAGMEAWCEADIGRIPLRGRRIVHIKAPRAIGAPRVCGDAFLKRSASSYPLRLDALVCESIFRIWKLKLPPAAQPTCVSPSACANCRRARRWSLDELSALSGVSRASLSRIENGEVSPTASVLGRLAGAHGLDHVASPRRDRGRRAGPRRAAPTSRSGSIPPPAFAAARFRRPRSTSSARFCNANCRPARASTIRCRRASVSSITSISQEGALELTIEGHVHRMSAGDCLRYKLMGASSFLAAGRRPARYILVLR